MIEKICVIERFSTFKFKKFVSHDIIFHIIIKCLSLLFFIAVTYIFNVNVLNILNVNIFNIKIKIYNV